MLFYLSTFLSLPRFNPTNYFFKQQNPSFFIPWKPLYLTHGSLHRVRRDKQFRDRLYAYSAHAEGDEAHDEKNLRFSFRGYRRGIRRRNADF